MKTLIVGVGALGGLVGARLLAAGAPVWLATRDDESARRLKAGGLRLGGVGPTIAVDAPNVAPLEAYVDSRAFDLVVLATKAHDALELAPRLPALLAPDGLVLPVQNGGVARLLADGGLGASVLGGVSNFGATMIAPGAYAQRNAGHFLIGELTGDDSERARRVQTWLGRAVDVRVTENFPGAVWSKLLLNCSITTIGAIAGQTMCQYMTLAEGRELFRRTYDEALSVALASGVLLERMIVDPVPPNGPGRSDPGPAYDAWISRLLHGYGDLKPSMLQDFERGRTTEIDFINGYVVALGKQLGVQVPANTAIVDTVHAITRKELAPDVSLPRHVLRSILSS